MSKRGVVAEIGGESERPLKKFKRICEKVVSLCDRIDRISEQAYDVWEELDTFDLSVFPNDPAEVDDPNRCEDPFVCHHSLYNPDDDMSMYDFLEPSMNTLLCLGYAYNCKHRTEFRGIKLRVLCKLIKPLQELDEMIGMSGVKKAVVDHIIFTLEGMKTVNRCQKCPTCVLKLDLPCQNQDRDMMHTVITGPPGVGKTELGKILGKVYTAMGLLSKGTFHIAKRSDLIAKFLGQTAIKTQQFIDKCEGGVMFIDEAYSLGNEEGKDIFSKECIDTINQNLTDKRDFLCIIAGYKDDLENCFFSRNKGLNRRFSFRYDVEGYSASELQQIFELKLKKSGWKIQEGVKLEPFFNKNHKSFPHFGGDIETLFFACRIAHNRRHFLTIIDLGRVLEEKDIEIGFTAFVENRKSKKDIDQIIYSMYT